MSQDPADVDPAERPETFVEAVLSGSGGRREDRPDERPCEVCQLDPETPTNVTRNRALFQAGRKLFIDPVCEHHDRMAPAQTIREAYEYGGPAFVEAVVATVLDGEDLYALVSEE